MRRFLLLLSAIIPTAVFANPPALPPSAVLPAPIAAARVTLPLPVAPSAILPLTPARTPLVPLSPLSRPGAPSSAAHPAAAYADAAAVVSRWNASVPNPAQRVYLHPDLGNFTLTVGGTRILSPSSYSGLWAAAMRPGVPPDMLSSADRAASRAFAEMIVAYQAAYRAGWGAGQGNARPPARPADPLQAALWDLDAKIGAIINGPGNPRLSAATNEFLRSVDMHRLLADLRTGAVGDLGENLAKALWRHDLSLAPVGQPYPRDIIIFDHQTGRSLSLADYIAAGFPDRIRWLFANN